MDIGQYLKLYSIKIKAAHKEFLDKQQEMIAK